MNQILKFSEQALEEVLEIHENLEDFKEGLGDRFYEKLRETTDQIKQMSESFQQLVENSNIRRAFLKLTRKLHYRIIYQILPDYIEIQSVKSTY